MYHGQCGLNVLVRSRKITEYQHEGRTYVEGREGNDYELSLVNNSYNRVLFVVSVDGLSTQDGQAAGPESNGYIVNSNQTWNIPGWMLDGQNAAKFKFGSKSDSYATQMTGTSVNNGVIGAIIYAEKVERRPWVSPYKEWPERPYRPYRPRPWRDHDPDWNRWDSDMLDSRESGKVYTQSILRNSAGSMSANAKGAELRASYNAKQLAGDLGTEFGESTNFRTTSVSFTRGEELGRIILYYETAENLRKRGIILRPVHVMSEANPFPADTGCRPPPNWRG